MALRLLRGTTAQRTGFTPAEGEPVWDINEQKLYVGDGATLGGIAIDVANASLSLDSLNDVDLTTPATTGEALVYDGNNFIAADATILSNKSVGDLGNVDITTSAPTTGQVLKWNGSAFVPGDDNSVAGTGLVSGATYDISIAGSVYTSDEVTLLVDGVAGKITGDVHSSVYSTDGNTLLVDAANSKITANVHASVYSTDGNTLLVDAAFARFGPGDFYGSLYSDDGNTLLVDGANGRIAGDLYGNLIAADNATLLVDRTNERFNGSVIGNVTGDVTGDTTGTHTGAVIGNLTGNVFATDNVSFLVDRTNARFNGNIAVLGNLTIDGTFPNFTGSLSSISETITSTSLTKKIGVDARLAMYGGKAGIDVYNDSDTADEVSVFSAFTASNTVEPSIELYRSRGTLANQLPLQDQDNLMLIAWGGADSDSALGLAAGIGASVDGTPTSGIVPGALSFLLTNSAGDFAPALQITNDGLIVSDNTVVAGVASGEVDDSAVVNYLKITVGSTTLALPLYAIRP